MNPRIFPFHFRLFALGTFIGVGSAHAANTAFVFVTDGNGVPTILSDTIKAREGADVTIVVIKPGTLPNINGDAVVDLGVVALPRFDLAIPGAPARHYAIAGDFELAANQSIWGWGSLALELEFTANATFDAGSLVNVSAIGQLGGPGGGNGGIPAPRTYSDIVFKDTKLGVPYVVGRGGAGLVVSTKGEDGQYVAGYQTAAATSPLAIPTYASSLSGGGGNLGQAAQFFISFQSGYTLPPVGGAGVASFAGVSAGGPGGAGGQPGSSDVFSSTPGLNGGPGNNGNPGANGVTGADGQVEAPGASNIHLRGGSGGGAGATGGTGLGAGTGGCGGGGGASGASSVGNYQQGGNGGAGGLGGSGGIGGLGGAGGGGAGALQIIVRGIFNASAKLEARGGEGTPGAAGGTGTAGAFGKAGTPGEQRIFQPNGGNGGTGGNGGKGGDGGKGGKGGSGSGGSIQLVASDILTTGEFDVTGGSGAQAGRFQQQDFQFNQTDFFGAFAMAPNPYRSYIADTSNPIPPLPSRPAGSTPLIPGLVGGPAAYGRLLEETAPNLTANVLAKLNPPPNCDAVVFRLDPYDLSLFYTGYDFLVIANVRPGRPSFSTFIGAVSPADAAAHTTLSSAPVLPTAQRTRQWMGWEADPLIVPGESGPEDYSVSYGFPWVTMLEKNKSFDVSAFYSPYGPARTFKGTPVTGLLSFSTAPQGVIYLNNTGRPRINLEVAGGDYTDNTLLGYVGEFASQQTIIRYVRLGSTPKVTMKVDNAQGDAWSLMSGTFQWTGAPLSDEENIGNFVDFNNVGKTDPAAVLSVDVPMNSSSWYANQPAGFANGYANLAIDSLPHPVNISIGARVVSPVGATAGLGYGDTLTGSSPAAGQTTPLTFQLANATTVPDDWATDLTALPKLTQLNILSAQFIGDLGGAFSLANPLPLGVPYGAMQDLTVNFTPPSAGTYHATLRLTTDGGVATGQPGQTFDVALTGGTGDFQTWVSSLPVDLRGTNDDANHNGVSNLLEYATGATSPAGLPTATPTGMQMTLPAVARPDVFLSVEGSSDLAAWQTVATRNNATGTWTSSPPATAATEQLLSDARTAAITVQGGLPQYFMRLNAALAPVNSYTNDFTSDAQASLLGSAVLDSGSLLLTPNTGGLGGSAVLSGVQAWSGQTGFAADFDLIMGPFTGAPADGMSFAVGDLGGGAFGENGPATTHNLSIAFDTYGATAPYPKGIRIMVNGATIASSTVDPFTNGQTWPAEVTYTSAGGVSVKYNGAMIFTNVAVPTFTLQAGDKFGFGARTGGFSQASRVDNVVISPR